MYRFSFAIAALLYVMTFQAAARCVLPVPDGGDVEPSPPSLVGVIARAAPGKLVVRTRPGTLERVLLNDQTGVWTVYGGGVDAAQLRPEQHALIWLEHCGQSTDGQAVAAVVQICSLGPERCPSATDTQSR